MSSARPFYVALCLLGTALTARAEKPNDNQKPNNDSPSNGSLQQTNSGYTKEWGGKSIHEWKRDLRDPDPTKRVEAMLAFINFQQAADVVPDIIQRLYDDGDASVRVKATILLRWIRPHDTDRTRIVRGLAHGLHDPQSVVRYEAAVSLQHFCPLNFAIKEERDVLQDLVFGLGQSITYELREACVVTLILAGVDPQTGPDSRVTDALITRANPLYEAATRVRIKAIMALGAQGRPRDPRKLDSVMGVLKMPANFNNRTHPAVRIWSHVAVIALDEKVNKKDLDTIADYLTNREAAIRAEAVRALGSLEEKADGYIGNIIDMLKKEKIPAVKAAGAEALGRMKNTGSRVLSTLISMTEEDSRESVSVVLTACFAFRMLNANSAEVIKALDKVRDHNSLEKWQKEWVRQIIDEIQNPKKKPGKEPVKTPEKGSAPKQNNRR